KPADDLSRVKNPSFAKVTVSFLNIRQSTVDPLRNCVPVSVEKAGEFLKTDVALFRGCTSCCGNISFCAGRRGVLVASFQHPSSRRLRSHSSSPRIQNILNSLEFGRLQD